MRRLIHVPIIHSAVDLGSLSGSLKAHYAKLAGAGFPQRREQAVEELWERIRHDIRALHLDERRVRIYQDGLPVCGFEEKIVRELAEAGSRNHQLIAELLDRGAALEGTEDPQLLMEEYEMHRQRLDNQAGCDRAREEQTRRAEHLLNARDAAIAKRIDATLQPGETGLVFLGALHRLDALQSTDVQVTTLGEESNEAVRRPGT